MKLAITGAGGFLGRNILERLKGNGCEVYAFSSQEDKLRSQFSEADNFHFANKAENIPSDLDVVLNCAFPRNEDGEQMAIGLEYIQKVFHQCVTNRAATVINISSQSVYSQKRGCRADESFPLNLESKYAVGKYATELLLNTICQNINHTNIRMASLIGRDFEQRIVNKFVKNALEKKELSIMAGKQSYGYLDVRDAADAIVTICMDYQNASQWDEVYNLGIKGTYSLSQIAQEVQKQITKEGSNKIQIKVIEQNSFVNTALNAELFYHTFNWYPRYTLADTVGEILRYHLEKGV